MKTIQSICLLIFLIPMAVWGESLTLPRVVNFNTVLTDAGGTPLPDGVYEVTFRILDGANEPLYSETQNLESVKGVVSTMVGEQGGLNLDLFQTGDPRFLSYEVSGETPEVRMEIVSVPYALVAQEAQSVAPKSVVTASIQPGAITRELLAEELIAELTSQIAPEALPSEVVMASELESFRAGLQAKDISVETDLIYSRGTNVSDTLRDLDTALHQRQINLSSTGLSLDTRITNEVVTLNSADSILNTRITNETGALSGRIDGAVTRIGTLETRANTLEGRMDINDPNSTLSTVKREAINAAVSAANSSAEANLAAMPQVRAWGSVVVVNPFPFDGTPHDHRIEGGYNLASIVSVPDLPNDDQVTHSFDIHFSEAIPTPYAVTCTAEVHWDEWDDDSSCVLIRGYKSENGFTLKTTNGADGRGVDGNRYGFQFTVVK